MLSHVGSTGVFESSPVDLPSHLLPTVPLDEVKMRFIYHYPETNGTDRDMLDAGALAEVAAAAERADSTDSASASTRPRVPDGWPPAGTRASIRSSRSAMSPPRPSGCGCTRTFPSRPTGTRSCSPRPRRPSTSSPVDGSCSGSAPGT
ncbi:hypothetical protein FRAHR75_200040 [Frankia sp. Hr75.2]|nr:hypothetical protein FRAHR75_200040 [Frankia sp. Hr75.2]